MHAAAFSIAARSNDSWRPEKLSGSFSFQACFENGAALQFKAAWAANIDSLGRTYFLGTKGGLALNPLEIYQNHQAGGLNLTSTPQGLVKVDDWQEKMHAFARAVRMALEPDPRAAGSVPSTKGVL